MQTGSRAPARYRNRPTELDGRRFDSHAEARRYAELRLLERAGRIADLQCQPRFSLVEAVVLDGRRKPAVVYQADFSYYDRDEGRLVVEDVKSPATARNPTYRLKRHLMLSVHGIEVREVVP